MTDKKKSKHSGATAPKKAKARFDKDPLPDKIGTSLRSLYDEVLNEEVPDDFLNLLRKADEASK